MFPGNRGAKAGNELAAPGGEAEIYTAWTIPFCKSLFYSMFISILHCYY